jgi:hypothetical protein
MEEGHRVWCGGYLTCSILDQSAHIYRERGRRVRETVCVWSFRTEIDLRLQSHQPQNLAALQCSSLQSINVL